MFKSFILALFKKNTDHKNGGGFTPLEIQKSICSFKGFKAKPPNGSALSITKFNGKFLTGFTLVELMVVTAIMMIMTAVVLINYRPGSQQLALDRSAHKLAQDIRRAQEMAMSSAEVEGSVPHGIGIIMAILGPEPQSPVPISKTRYYIYADKDGSGELEVPPTLDIIISRIDLESGVYIDNINVNSISISVLHRGVINFSPPDPEVNIIKKTGSDSYPGTEMEIVLALEVDSSKTKTVRVNNAGLIYVE